MMDCNVTTNFLAELKRMHEENKVCETCPISAVNNGEGCTCDKFLRMCGDKAIKIVQEWSDSHPQKTRLSVVKETFPIYTRCIGTDIPAFCSVDCDTRCVKCWNTPIGQEVK